MLFCHGPWPGLEGAALVRRSCFFNGDSMSRVLLVVASVMLSAMFLACGGGVRQNKNQNPGQNEPDPKVLSTKLAGAVTVDAKSLLKKYKDDAGAADKEYKDKWLVVEGAVEQVATDNRYIMLKSDAGKVFVQCLFGKEWDSELAKMTAGKQAKICGQCSGLAGNVVLKDCFFPDAIPELSAKKAKREAEQEAARVANEAKAKSAKADPVTVEKYHQVQTGMNYNQVVGIIGVKGVELSRVEIEGISTVVVSWSNRNGSNMNVTFQGGQVVAKAQFGLK